MQRARYESQLFGGPIISVQLRTNRKFLVRIRTNRIVFQCCVQVLIFIGWQLLCHLYFRPSSEIETTSEESIFHFIFPDVNVSSEYSWWPAVQTSWAAQSRKRRPLLYTCWGRCGGSPDGRTVGRRPRHRCDSQSLSPHIQSGGAPGPGTSGPGCLRTRLREE